MRALRKGQGSPPGACSPASGARCANVEELWHWALGADGGHGHAQPPFRSSRLIGAERQPTSDCRQSFATEPAVLVCSVMVEEANPQSGYESAIAIRNQLSLEHVELLRCFSPCSCCYTNLSNSSATPLPTTCDGGLFAGRIGGVSSRPGTPNTPAQLTGVIHCQRIGPVL